MPKLFHLQSNSSLALSPVFSVKSLAVGPETTFVSCSSQMTFFVPEKVNEQVLQPHLAVCFLGQDLVELEFVLVS
jgi:hypothetical protein